jgi:signal transduction histidine kinase
MSGVLWTRDPIDELRGLHACLRDLAAMSVAPPRWSAGLPSAISESLQELVVRALRSEQLFVRLGDSGGSPAEGLLHLETPQRVRLVRYPTSMTEHIRHVPSGSPHADYTAASEARLTQVSTDDITSAIRNETPLRRRAVPVDRLQTRVSQQAAMARLSQQALTTIPLHDLLQEGVIAAREGLGADCAELLQLSPDGNTLLLTAGSGWSPGVIGVAHVSSNESSLAGYALAAEVPVIVQDARAETRFENWKLLRDHAVVSSIGMVLRGIDRPFGVLAAHCVSRHEFSADDAQFLQSLANLLAVALQRRHADSEHEHLRARTHAAHAEAERVSHEQTLHLATMSHELRTPLNAMAGYIEMMEMGVHGPLTAAQRADLGRIRHNQRYLLRVINSVLTFMKLESGRAEYELSDVPIAEVLAAVEETVRPLMQAKQLKYKRRKPEIELRVIADSGRMQQILVNLLANATKFTDPRGVVEVDFVADANVVRTQVRDSGCGIPSAELERIFQPFVQVGDPVRDSTEGTGLGLAISRQLAEGMNGRLYAESDRGRGSTFTLELPRGT